MRSKEQRDDLFIGGFSLKQPESGYRFTMDAAILSAVAPVLKRQQVLDIGCGSGVIPLLLLGREASLQITGIELNKKMADLARENMAYNHVPVTIIHGDAMKASELLPGKSFDVIVSNPPYYPVNSGRIPANPEVAMAKMEIFWNRRSFFREAAVLLKEDGLLCMTMDVTFSRDLVSLGPMEGLHLKKQISFTKEQRPLNCLYMEWTRKAVTETEKTTMAVEEVLNIYGTGIVSGGDTYRQS